MIGTGINQGRCSRNVVSALKNFLYCLFFLPRDILYCLCGSCLFCSLEEIAESSLRVIDAAFRIAIEFPECIGGMINPVFTGKGKVIYGFFDICKNDTITIIIRKT